MQKAKGYNTMAAAMPSPTWMIVAWLKRMHVDVIIDHVVVDYLEVRYTEHVERQTRDIGGGRPGPNLPGP